VRTVAVLPVKRFAHAKQRLRDAVDGEPRERLAGAMVGDVLDTLARSRELAAVVVVTNEPIAMGLARRTGAHLVADPDEAGQSPAAKLGIAKAVDELEAERVLLVPGDTPAMENGELDALLAYEEDIVIVPDRHGEGTNALLLTPPDAIEPAFGEGSRERHERAARECGRSYAVAELPSLMLDVDTPDDLAALRDTGHTGERTRALL
jgi:2-phospho-L-lactate guanylyltransferase